MIDTSEPCSLAEDLGSSVQSLIHSCDSVSRGWACRLPQREHAFLFVQLSVPKKMCYTVIHGQLFIFQSMNTELMLKNLVHIPGNGC
jgi:hypothetical protein